MSDALYVIVYRDGYMGRPCDREASDATLRDFDGIYAFKEGPAYRLRIRKKAKPKPRRATK